MNLDRLRGMFTRNKVALGALGAAAVAALAWRARTSAGAGTDSQGAAAATTGYSSAGGQLSGATGYDSTASDVYNAIQPQLEDLRDLFTGAQSIPVPVPAEPEPAAAPDAYTVRRSAIADFYTTILNRQKPPATWEVNFWDATGKSLDQIRASILRSPEAKGVTT